jgi:hypothetical protein
MCLYEQRADVFSAALAELLSRVKMSSSGETRPFCVRLVLPAKLQSTCEGGSVGESSSSSAAEIAEGLLLYTLSRIRVCVFFFLYIYAYV